MYTRLFTCLIILLFMSCHQQQPPVIYSPGSFGYDLQFLQRHDTVVVLENGDNKIIVSPRYQAKVFTSTNAGDTGHSFGWIHYKAFDGPEDPHMNAYGGENRIWVGPEGGMFSLFFPPGTKMAFANWRTPPPFDTEAWEITEHTTQSVTLLKEVELQNYSGTLLKFSVSRKIELLDRPDIERLLDIAADTALRVVGYRTENLLTNTDQINWTENTGMPCLWLLDMFPPSPSTVIAIPYDTADHSKPATTDYFGEIPADRLKIDQGTLFFKADGTSRGKLGIHPQRARPVAGSYDAIHRILTITLFDVNTGARYLNQEWNTTKPPFSGDAVNAYNDGPLADGSQMGPFYELESVSPAAFLRAGQSQIHRHSVFHFTGPESALDVVSKQVLDVPLAKIKQAF
jgi:hypothetical protein